MMEFINNLKRKPEHVRKRIALFTTIAIFSLIVNVWWISWKTPVSENSVAITEAASPLGVVADMVFGLKGYAEHMAKTVAGQLQNSASSSTPESQTANVSASEVGQSPTSDGQNNEAMKNSTSSNKPETN